MISFRRWLFVPSLLLLLCSVNGCTDNAVMSSLAEARTVTSLEASSIRQDAVDLRWQCNDTLVTSFIVSWKGGVLRDSGSLMTDQKQTRVEGLNGGQYIFRVFPVRNGEQLVPSTIAWAGAQRFDRDPSTGQPLRLYERFSSRASGLVIDITTGNPKLLDLTLPATFPPTPVALQIQTASLNSTEFSIGPPAAYLPTRNWLDSIAAISDVAFAVESLDKWFLSGPIDRLINNDGNVKAFNRIPAVPGNSAGVGFLLRVGFGTDVAPYHYARVFVKNIDGRLLQGTAPDRYVELEISYQVAASLPFAKGGASSVVYRSERPPSPPAALTPGPSPNAPRGAGEGSGDS